MTDTKLVQEQVVQLVQGQQPAPRKSGKVVFDLLEKYIYNVPNYDNIRKELKSRYEVGMKKYGQPLMTDDGRDTKQDAREELLDCIMYMIGAIEKGDDLDDLQPLVDVINNLVKRSSKKTNTIIETI